jgi:peptide chain release factor subunit 1
MFILKSLKSLPKNGLAIFCGLVVNEENSKGKTTKIAYSFEPLQPINRFLYMCDNKFHPQDLIKNMSTSEATYGFLICNGDGAYFATLSGSQKKMVQQIRDITLPNKHNKGGQSAPRFGRIREEMIHVYIKKVGEMATKAFIHGDKPIITALIVAGSGSLKTRLLQSGWIDPRILKLHLATVDTAYGGEIGFNQAIELSGELLTNVEIEQERRSIVSFMHEIEMNSSKFVYGIEDTMACLEMRIVKKLIIWEGLELDRVTTEEGIEFLKKGVLPEGKLVERTPLIDYLIENQKSFGMKMQIVTKSCSEGQQFIQGFGGFGGILNCEYHMNDKFLDMKYNDKDKVDDDISDQKEELESLQGEYAEFF